MKGSAPPLCASFLLVLGASGQTPSSQQPGPPSSPQAPQTNPATTPAPASLPNSTPVPPPSAGILPPAPIGPGAGTPTAAPGDPQAAGPGALFDNRLPMLDPSGGLVRFNGQTWDIANNAIFRSRFEKYLNTPEESGQSEREHREILNKIIDLLDPNRLTAQTLTDAYRLLNRAAAYPGDSRLCDTLSNAIYSIWAVKRNQGRLDEANRILKEENNRLQRNLVRKASEEEFPSRPEGRSSKNGSRQDPSAGQIAPMAQPNALGNAPVGVPPPPPTSAGTQNTTGTPQPPSSSTTISTGSIGAGTPPTGGQPMPAAVVNTQVVNSSGTAAQANSPGEAGQALGAGVQQGASTAAGATGKAIAMAAYAEKLVENSVRMKANSLKGDVSEIQAKIEFQSLLMQLFLQRRFHHVVIGTRFHRALFGDGESRLNLPEATQGLFKLAGGLSPTVSTLEALSNEAMRDVQTSVQSFNSLLGLGELRSASERLRDALLIGEFLPEIRTLPFERKRKVLRFVQKANQLLSAIEVKDYTAATELLNGPEGLRSLAPDFDASKPSAMIEGARNAARLHLARARNAAISGNKAEFEAALKEAGAIWPNNPELQEVSAKAFTQGDQMAQVLLELDQLISQKNLRRIAEEPGRFLAATQGAPPERQAQLKKILEDFKSIEAALLAAKEMDRQGNPSGAWESVGKAARDFPDDLQINQAKALYTTKAADFVRTIQSAQEHETRSELATSLAWYLKAQRLYPKSDVAEEAIVRLKSLLLPAAP
jgi:hypothetical protein